MTAKEMDAHRYNPEHKNAWDDFVQASKNGTFLFRRDYMEYHRDRFEDFSLIVRDDTNAIVALFPANRLNATVVSHGGLTYGGFVTDDTMKVPKMLETFAVVLQHLAAAGCDTLLYKTIPYIYHRAPAEEDRLALALCGARRVRCGAMAVVAAQHAVPFQQRRMRGARKAQRAGLTVRESEDFAAYWNILEQRLAQTHSARPVHSIDEIALLHRLFPNQIRLFGAFNESEMLAGVVIHETDRVARTQYIAANDRGQELGALDLIFTELLTGLFKAKPYFDFGTSDEDEGRKVNRGLMDQKEGYGARMVAHDHYEIAVATCDPAKLREALV